MPDECPGFSARSDIILPAQNTWREYRYLVSGAVLFSPGPGIASDHPPLSPELSTTPTIRMLPSGWITR